jgi:hypothetical protein
MSPVVIDTNVILVANGQHADVRDDCVAACARHLHSVMGSGKVVIDDAYRILSEYQNKSLPALGKRPGDAFVKWLLRNNANPERCDQVSLVDHDERGFESFPDDERLLNFDPPDRKFVAVAVVHPKRPPISQAADSKWLGWAIALGEHGVRVEFLCSADIQGFAANKSRKKAKRA